MIRVLIVCPYPHGRAPSQRFRFEQFLDIEGMAFEQRSFWNEGEWPRIYKDGSIKYKVLRTIAGFARRFRLLWGLVKYDKIFIHREATPIGPPWFEWIVANLYRKQVIFDFDDAIWLPNSSEANRKLAGKLKFHDKTAKICSWAKTVVVGNEYLAKYANQFCDDVRVIPTTIDTENLHNPNLYERIEGKWRKKPNPIGKTAAGVVDGSNYTSHSDSCDSKAVAIPTIGWTGTHSTLKQLTPLFPLLEEVHKNHPFRFLLIADVAPSSLPVFAEFRKWEKETEIEDLMEMDIGIMPLFDTDWEKGKCGFKALQYQALGIPAVVSDVGVNDKVVIDGVTGFLAESLPLDSRKRWQRSLEKLLTQTALRNKLGASAQVHVVDNYSVNSQKEKFRDLFRKASD